MQKTKHPMLKHRPTWNREMNLRTNQDPAHPEEDKDTPQNQMCIHTTHKTNTSKPFTTSHRNHSHKQKIHQKDTGTNQDTWQFCCYIFVSLFGVKILNIILCMLRCRVYVCVCRWALCIRPRGLWLSTGIDVHLRQASKMYMTTSVSIPRRCMRIDSVRF